MDEYNDLAGAKKIIYELAEKHGDTLAAYCKEHPSPGNMDANFNILIASLLGAACDILDAFDVKGDRHKDIRLLMASTQTNINDLFLEITQEGEPEEVDWKRQDDAKRYADWKSSERCIY